MRMISVKTMFYEQKNTGYTSNTCGVLKNSRDRMTAINPYSNPCLTCGACCAFYRASFYWGETDESPSGIVPAEFTEQLNDFYCVMKGTNQPNPRCIALHGVIGENVSCLIYERRSSVCREFEASWAHGIPNERCDKARAAWGLPPLSPTSWSRPEDFLKAA